MRCVGKCVLRCEVKKQDTQERPDGVLVCGVQKKKGETERNGKNRDLRRDRPTDLRDQSDADRGCDLQNDSWI